MLHELAYLLPGLKLLFLLLLDLASVGGFPQLVFNGVSINQGPMRPDLSFPDLKTPVTHSVNKCTSWFNAAPWTDMFQFHMEFDHHGIIVSNDLFNMALVSEGFSGGYDPVL